MHQIFTPVHDMRSADHDYVRPFVSQNRAPRRRARTLHFCWAKGCWCACEASAQCTDGDVIRASCRFVSACQEHTCACEAPYHAAEDPAESYVAAFRVRLGREMLDSSCMGRAYAGVQGPKPSACILSSRKMLFSDTGRKPTYLCSTQYSGVGSFLEHLRPQLALGTSSSRSECIRSCDRGIDLSLAWIIGCL
ncbi:hypothetical protein BV20DRAFT_282414 [Pilatotrama ljubarskyi]|nr:hypothetical protein BV20DRAFT_282414 [Pilatotrama ljubarskyi]